jgi:hypothetical protein
MLAALEPRGYNPNSLQGLGSAWTDFLNWGQDLTGKILTAQYGTPQYAPGTYIQRGPQGEIVYRAPDGAGGYFSAAGGAVGANLGQTGISTTTLLLVGGAVVLVMVMANRRG